MNHQEQTDEGKKFEQEIVELALAQYLDKARAATDLENKYEHWDVRISKDGQVYRIDTKAKELKDLFLVEFVTVVGWLTHKGWLFSDYTTHLLIKWENGLNIGVKMSELREAVAHYDWHGVPIKHKKGVHRPWTTYTRPQFDGMPSIEELVRLERRDGSVEEMVLPTRGDRFIYIPMSLVLSLPSTRIGYGLDCIL